MLRAIVLLLLKMRKHLPEVFPETFQAVGPVECFVKSKTGKDNSGFLLPQMFVQRPKRSEEHTSELQSLMRISYAVFCLKKKKKNKRQKNQDRHEKNTNNRY